MGAAKLLSTIFLANLLIVFGAIYYLTASASVSGLDLKQVSIQQVSQTDPSVVSGKPVGLTLKSVDVDIEVIDGTYDVKTGEWSLSDDKAHYALMTPEANNTAGNTFIYGHNKKEVFSSLKNLKVGDEAVVKTDDGKEFYYRLTSSKEVPPSDVSLFEYRGSPILTIQTCSGTWYEKRMLFTFEFKSYKDPKGAESNAQVIKAEAESKPASDLFNLTNTNPLNSLGQ